MFLYACFKTSPLVRQARPNWAKGHYTEGAELIDSVLDKQGSRVLRLLVEFPDGWWNRLRPGHSFNARSKNTCSRYFFF